MNAFLTTLKFRNEPLFYFGLMCLLTAFVLLAVARGSQLRVTGTNAWYKPIKFALSIGMLCWSMGWFCWYLQMPRQVAFYNWATIILLAFELVYITYQAWRGQQSHYNRSTPLYSALYTGMAFAATAVTLHTAYMGILFCSRSFPQLPGYYLLSIRSGIFLFVIFAFEGAVMGSMNAHTIGGPDGGNGIPFLNWSRKFGDARIAHFIGMHALQVLPLLAYYVLKDTRLTLLSAVVYTALAVMVLAQALNRRPLIRERRRRTDTVTKEIRCMPSGKLSNSGSDKHPVMLPNN